MSRHRTQLREYLLNVTRDLVQRGVIRQAAGVPLDKVLTSELAKVAREVEEDLVTILAEAGISFLAAARGVLGSFLMPGAGIKKTS